MEPVHSPFPPVPSSIVSRRKLNTRKRNPIFLWADQSLTPFYVGMALTQDPDESEMYQEVLASEDPSSWKAAMEEEMDSLSKNETWTLVPLTPGRVAIKNRRIFKLKYRS